MDGKITINVPNDLKKISRKKYIIRISLLIAVYMVEVILFAVYYDKFMSAIPSYAMLNIFGYDSYTGRCHLISDKKRPFMDW